MAERRSISYDDDFTGELMLTPELRFRMTIETSDPEKFARFRQALACAEAILRLPDYRGRDAELLSEMFEWG